MALSSWFGEHRQRAAHCSMPLTLLTLQSCAHRVRCFVRVGDGGMLCSEIAQLTVSVASLEPSLLVPLGCG